jgi:hypothetical protein
MDGEETQSPYNEEDNTPPTDAADMTPSEGDNTPPTDATDMSPSEGDNTPPTDAADMSPSEVDNTPPNDAADTDTDEMTPSEYEAFYGDDDAEENIAINENGLTE